jgi:hypothetical protein
LRGDRQAQAGSAVFARGGVVGLRERLEDPPLLVRRDADPGIGDGEVQNDVVMGHGSCVMGHV